MNIFLKIILLLSLLPFSQIPTQAQVILPLYHQPEQDICHAYTVCSDTFFNYKSYMGVGAEWESVSGSNPFSPVPPFPSPSPYHSEDSLRENSHWLKFVIAESGYLAIDLIPMNTIDFFNILVYKSNGQPCSNGSGFSLVRSASNKLDVHYAPTYNITGIKLDSSESTHNKAEPLYVNAGETYYVRILAASGYQVINPILTIAKHAKGGYVLDLSMKTCKFEIGPPPLVAEVLGNGCENENFIDILLNRNINCNSIEINGSDFSISPHNEITGAIGTGCSFGEGLTSKIRLYFDGILPPGDYNLHIQEGDDGNTLLDLCYQESPFPQSIPFTVQKLRDTATLYICSGALPYTWNGITFTDTGSMIGSYKTDNISGCDSFTYLNLYTVDSFVHYETVYACADAFPIYWYGGLTTSDYGESVLRYVFTAHGGCDSIIYLNVMPQMITYTDTEIVACSFIEINDIIFTESGIYIDTLYNDLMCVSEIITYDINVFSPVSVENLYVDTGSCGHLIIDDRLIISDTAFTDTLLTWFGCDSVYIHYNIDITPQIEPETFRYHMSVCDSFNVHEVLITQDTVLKFLFKNQYNCDSVVNIYYITIDTLDLELVSFPQVPVKGEVTQIYAGSSQANINIQYWEPADIFPNQNSPDQSIVITEPISISVLAIDSRGCMATDTLVIHHVDSLIKHEAIPNAFSPNGDGLNDVFTINLPNERGREIKSVFIYDRWGKVVFSDFGGVKFQWNGTYGNTGELATAGVYYFQIILQYIDGEEKIITGDVTLLR